MTDHRIFDWEGTTFVSSSRETEQFTQFARDFRYGLYHLLGEKYKIEKWLKGHFEVSGFIRNTETDKLAYFSISDVRFFQDRWLNNVLVRTAQDTKDYKGGTNQYTELENIRDLVRRITT